MVEQRHEAVREVLDTIAPSITDVATRYGVDRRTLHRWLLRYAKHGLAGVADRSSSRGSSVAEQHCKPGYRVWM